MAGDGGQVRKRWSMLVIVTLPRQQQQQSSVSTRQLCPCIAHWANTAYVQAGLAKGLSTQQCVLLACVCMSPRTRRPSPQRLTCLLGVSL